MVKRGARQLTVEVRNKPAVTELRLLAVLNVLFKYASRDARHPQHADPGRASQWQIDPSRSPIHITLNCTRVP